MGKTRWHADTYKFRALLCVPAATAGADPYFTFIPNAGWDLFWDNIDSNGYGIRFFFWDGTATPHNRATWTYATETATFNVDYQQLGATDESEFFWVYWSPTTPADGSAAVTTTTAVTKTQTSAVPNEAVLAGLEAPGVATPLARFSKTTVAPRYVWFDITDWLGDSDTTYNHSSSSSYQLQYIDWDATAGTGVYLAGARQAAMTTQSLTLAMETQSGRTLIGIYVTGGTVDVDYTVSLRATLAPVTEVTGVAAHLFEARALLQVRDPAE